MAPVVCRAIEQPARHVRLGAANALGIVRYPTRGHAGERVEVAGASKRNGTTGSSARRRRKSIWTDRSESVAGSLQINAIVHAAYVANARGS